eukprot:Blabericola_migrator_1__8504@NODE_443_length_8422_cov_363_622023_g348_i0_p2_GENE_NODE_443_length_8422_cov_363_622023_g348_i0NODE_443_length_8422_cov_363_622023_g348_i0_p2_ORF_typecomplete_len591_score70_43PHO4/PF01384_20/9_9e102Shisa/PF13908_6/6_7e03Shisa/PF13908_6/0_099DUF3169/PF11368_8/9e03DUF3169/PF11368_8/1_1e02DUF3169/PF11368_8/0_41Podoplanin/PF05808_11/0_23Podoplanin/PF05808_11/3_1e03_NODE_443_length_8422_cov_363_622023_g348_i04572229
MEIGQLDEYLWCVILGSLFCFTLGFGIGAQDVSNNFGTSIGSKSISLKKAIIIAAIFELVGSVGLGASVTDAVRKGVYYVEKFGPMPDIVLVANLTALIITTCWLLLASTRGWPVSTTHSLVGAMLGCGLAFGGSAVNWRYIGTVVLGWVIAPCIAVVVAMIYFGLLRSLLLRKPNSVQLGFKCLWGLIFLTCAVFCVFFMFSNPLRISSISCKQKSSSGVVTQAPCVVDKWAYANVGIAIGVAFGIAVVLTIILCPFVYMRAKKMIRKFDEEEAAAAERAAIAVASEEAAVYPHKVDASYTSIDVTHGKSATPQQDDSSAVAKALKLNQLGDSTVASLSEAGRDDLPAGCKGGLHQFMDNMPWNADLHAEAYDDNAKSRELAETVESFGARTEAFFMTLQIISASVACLVHGSNDVSNAAAPLASIYSIYRAGEFQSQVSVPIWILVLGGSAIAVGLTFLGHKVIKKVGIELLAITPCRGFCIEMALGTVMIVASFSGITLSTTHVAVGSMIGVAFLDRKFDPTTKVELPCKKILGLNFSTVNWRTARKIAVGWIFTLIATACGAAALFAFALYTPTKVGTRYIPISEI